MFEGFTTERVKTSGAEIALVRGGHGAPLLLVHGYPQTHLMWHKVAPGLAQRFTVIAPDLRGYGASSKPPADDEHLNYSKRSMAQDLVEIMARLGFKQFDIAGHDRGARVTYRLALDHPECVRRAAVLDIIPTLEQFERMNRLSARGLSLVFSGATITVSRNPDRKGPGLFPRPFARSLARGCGRVHTGGARRIPRGVPKSGNDPRDLRGLSRRHHL